MKRCVQVLFFLFFIALASHASAQCSICAAQVETNVKEGNDQAKGLNSGILYLLSAPYLLVVGAGFLWFKKYRKKDVIVNIKDEKIHLN